MNNRPMVRTRALILGLVGLWIGAVIPSTAEWTEPTLTLQELEVSVGRTNLPLVSGALVQEAKDRNGATRVRAVIRSNAPQTFKAGAGVTVQTTVELTFTAPPLKPKPANQSGARSAPPKPTIATAKIAASVPGDWRRADGSLEYTGPSRLIQKFELEIPPGQTVTKNIAVGFACTPEAKWDEKHCGVRWLVTPTAGQWDTHDGQSPVPAGCRRKYWFHTYDVAGSQGHQLHFAATFDIDYSLSGPTTYASGYPHVSYSYEGRSKYFEPAPATPPPPPIQLTGELLDANPLYTNTEDIKTLEPKALLDLRHVRRGAVADGVSVLIVRAKVSEKGTAKFSVGKSDGRCEPLFDGKTQSLDGKTHYAFAAYWPPAEFGKTAGGEAVQKLEDAVEYRKVPLKIAFQSEHAGGAPAEFNLPVIVARPPVVLMHGTYDNPTECWATRSPETPSLRVRLRARGFAVYLVDYSRSNGNSTSAPSRFSDNKWVVWSNEQGGIQKALEEFRSTPLSLAATKADVVGHSMGGVLPRVYASDHYKKLVDGKEHRYRRAENFNQGDINRLITIGSTHYGSDIPRIFGVFKSSKVDDLAPFSQKVAGAAYWYVDYSTGLDSGAALDQIPGSVALQLIGPTQVPSHAIGCVAVTKDLEAYNGEYIDRCKKICWVFQLRPDLLPVVFPPQGQEFEGDAARLKAQIDAIGERYGFETDRVTGEKSSGYYNDLALLDLYFRAAVFGNTPNDCTVRIESQWGGLDPKYTSLICHALHGYEPRYRAVQDRVIELLLDGLTYFASDGFPLAGKPPTNLPPGHDKQTERMTWTKVTGDDALRLSNIAKAPADAVAAMSKESDAIVLLRPAKDNAVAYDLLALGSHGSPGKIQRDAELGYVSDSQKALIAKLNGAVKTTGVAGSVFRHGPDAQSPDSASPTYPILAFEPPPVDQPGAQGAMVSIPRGPLQDPDRFLKEYFREKQDKGYWLMPGTAWGWQHYNGCDGFDATALFSPPDATGRVENNPWMTSVRIATNSAGPTAVTIEPASAWQPAVEKARRSGGGQAVIQRQR